MFELSGMVVIDVMWPNQKVPVVLENFWSSSTSKTTFQAFYDWNGSPLITVSNLSTLVYHLKHGWYQLKVVICLAQMHKRGSRSDRMQFYVQYIINHRSGPTSVTLSSR